MSRVFEQVPQTVVLPASFAVLHPLAGGLSEDDALQLSELQDLQIVPRHPRIRNHIVGQVSWQHLAIVLTARLTQGAVAGDPLSQIMFPDHTDLPPAAALQMQDPLRLNHLQISGSSHVKPAALLNQLF